MGEAWRDCVLILIDLIGTTENARDGRGSRKMRDLLSLVKAQRPFLREIDHIYAWNDAVMLLSYLDNSGRTHSAIVRDAERLKRKIDRIQTSFAIAVKGQTFPKLQMERSEGLTILEASSWAFANCFLIERELKIKKKHGT